MNDNMKTIGLVGGTGWISTLDYYRVINETVNRKLGGLNAARCILYSINYNDIDTFNKQSDFPGVYRLVLDAARRITGAGADFIILCANTLHRFADDLEKEISVPILHIVGAAAKKINEHGISTVGLLGTKQTMELDFYMSRLRNEGIETLVPDKEEREFIDNTIRNELLKGIINPSSRAAFQGIMKKLGERGAEGIVLGCTEIPLLIRQEDSELPVFDTTVIHAQAAAEYAVSEVKAPGTLPT